jgi:Ca2+-binding EF-hand superfamily protein
LTLLDKKKDGVIDEDDLNQVFMSLGHKTKKGEIADMIWEVDEDPYNALNWKVRCLRIAATRCSLPKHQP